MYPYMYGETSCGWNASSQRHLKKAFFKRRPGSTPGKFLEVFIKHLGLCLSRAASSFCITPWQSGGKGPKLTPLCISVYGLDCREWRRRALWRTAAHVKTTWLRPWSITCCQQTRGPWWRPSEPAWGLLSATPRHVWGRWCACGFPCWQFVVFSVY